MKTFSSILESKLVFDASGIAHPNLWLWDKSGTTDVYYPVKQREFHYENEMCEAVGLRTSCNSCDRIIWADEFDAQTYYPMGYCPDCAKDC